MFLLQGEHSIYSCRNFQNISVIDRNQFIKRNPSICINCVREGHTVNKCRIGPCKKCKSRHNTVLHLDIKKPPQGQDSAMEENQEKQSANSLSSSVVSAPTGQVILSTASILITDNKNQYHLIRVLLDCGSQTSFITEGIQRKLNISVLKTDLSVVRIANKISSVRNKCDVRIKSRQGFFVASLTCYILPEITGDLPITAISTINLKIPSHIKLADPDFFKPAPIDMLIGADLFW